MKKKILLILVILISNVINSQTTLVAGDIAIIQYNSDGNPEILKFVALTSMESGTTINFTDNGWVTTGTPAFRTGEADTPHTWTAASAVTCGDIITVSIPNGPFNLGASGDQVFAYQGTAASPTFIFAINNEGNGVWQTSATSARNSGLPSTLTNGTNAVAIKEVDNVVYSGSLSGSKAVVLSNICDKNNWNSGTSATSSNTVNQTFTGDFNTTWNGTIWDGTGSNFLNTTINGSYSTSSDGNFKTCNCTVNASQTLTVNSGGTVTVEDDITNNGSIVVESGGSVVQILPNGTNTGTSYTVERASTSQSSYHVFTYWSTPITSATFAAVAPSTHLYYSFNDGSQTWVEGNSTTAMSPGIGYALEGPDSGTYPGVQTSTFTGAPFNNGNISRTLSFSADADADNDWNLVGNPYPSAIDADTFLADNSSVIGGTIYFWTHNTPEDGTENNTEDDYAMFNGTGSAAASGGAAPDGNIASGQGFFVQALSSGVVSDFFTNSMRIEGNNTTFFKSAQKVKSTNKTRDRIWLNLTNQKSFSQILVGFIDDATDGEDSKYDGVRFLGKTSLNLYSISNDKNYGIQGKSSLREIENIPLGFSSDVKGEFRISIDRFEGKIENSNVYLEDILLNTKHNLKMGDYVFSTGNPGEFNNRFNLVLETDAAVLNIKENTFSKNILIQSLENDLVIKTLDNSIIKKVLVYNLLGQKLILKENSTASLKIKFSNLKPNSVLFVKTILENGQVFINKIYKN
ncbi:MAG: hypothetical protein AB8B78_11430 [Polaribacter sp.]